MPTLSLLESRRRFGKCLSDLVNKDKENSKELTLDNKFAFSFFSYGKFCMTVCVFVLEELVQRTKLSIDGTKINNNFSIFICVSKYKLLRMNYVRTYIIFYI